MNTSNIGYLAICFVLFVAGVIICPSPLLVSEHQFILGMSGAGLVIGSVIGAMALWKG